MLTCGRAVFTEVGTEDRRQGVKEQKDGEGFRAVRGENSLTTLNAEDK